jgi:hypothetical protein
VKSLIARFDPRQPPYWRTLPEDVQETLAVYMIDEVADTFSAKEAAHDALDEMDKEQIEEYLREYCEE